MAISRVIFLSLFLLCWSRTKTFAGDTPVAPTTMPVTCDQLRQTSGETLKRLKSSGAKWFTTRRAGAGGTFIAEWTVTPGGSRATVGMDQSGVPIKFFTVIVRDGEFYASDSGGHRRYKAYAYPFHDASAGQFFCTSSLRLFDTLPANTEIEKADGERVLCRIPMTALARQTVQEGLDRYQALVKEQGADYRIDEKSLNDVESLKDMIAHGIRSVIDSSTGIVIESGIHDACSIRNFEWLDKPAPEAIDVSKTAWEDFTDGPTSHPSKDVVFFEVDSLWSPGTGGAGNFDGRLYDKASHRSWRVPFRGGVTVGSAAFLPDHQSIVVCGVVESVGVTQPFLINLKTGENKPIGGKAVEIGECGQPAVSPDGLTASILRRVPGPRPRAQLIMIDLKTGEGREVGPPMNIHQSSWLPDNSEVVVGVRSDVPDEKPRVKKISKDGTVSDLFEGGDPVVVSGLNLIVFDASGTRTKWCHCNFDGTNVIPLGDGLAHFLSPAPSADGMKLIMIDHNEDKTFGPIPSIIHLGDMNVERIDVGPGYWTEPAW